MCNYGGTTSTSCDLVDEGRWACGFHLTNMGERINHCSSVLHIESSGRSWKAKRGDGASLIDSYDASNHGISLSSFIRLQLVSRALPKRIPGFSRLTINQRGLMQRSLDSSNPCYREVRMLLLPSKQRFPFTPVLHYHDAAASFAP
jgi:hypothetical protein